MSGCCCVEHHNTKDTNLATPNLQESLSYLLFLLFARPLVELTSYVCYIKTNN